MAYIGRNPEFNTVGFTAQDSDPAGTPSTGDRFYASASHGTRSQGFYTYNGSAWVKDSSAAVLSVSTKSASYTILDDDGIETILVDDTSSDRTITLPTAADNTNRKITVKNTSTHGGLVTVDGEGAETIDGAATYVLYLQNESVTVVCDGTSWSIIDEVKVRIIAAYKTSNADVYTNAVAEVVCYDTVILDTHSAVTFTNFAAQDWIFTAPAGGVYGIHASQCLAGTTTFSGTETNIMTFLTNGSPDERILTYPTVDNSAKTIRGDSLVNLSKGDTIKITITQSSGGDLPQLGSSADNRIKIYRIK